MTAMLTLRRADPCNRGAGGERCAAASHLLLPTTSPAQARDIKEKGHCQLPLALELREARKPESQGRSKPRGLCLSLLLQAVLVGLPIPLPYLWSYRGISVAFKLALENSQACGSCTVTLQ